MTAKSAWKWNKGKIIQKYDLFNLDGSYKPTSSPNGQVHFKADFVLTLPTAVRIARNPQTNNDHQMTLCFIVWRVTVTLN